MPCVYLPGPAPAVTVANSDDEQNFLLIFTLKFFLNEKVNDRDILLFCTCQQRYKPVCVFFLQCTDIN
jgi:hypothetical protein